MTELLIIIAILWFPLGFGVKALAKRAQVHRVDTIWLVPLAWPIALLVTAFTD